MIQDGGRVRSWQDALVPGFGKLKDHSLSSVPQEDNDSLMANFAANNGWNWAVLSQMVLAGICACIASIKPPRTGRIDFPIWSSSLDGIFSIKTAYHMFYL